MIIRVDWDLTDDDNDGEAYTLEEVGIPAVVEVPDDIPEEDVSDYLSDNYGWCVNSWRLIQE